MLEILQASLVLLFTPVLIGESSLLVLAQPCYDREYDIALQLVAYWASFPLLLCLTSFVNKQPKIEGASLYLIPPNTVGLIDTPNYPATPSYESF